MARLSLTDGQLEFWHSGVLTAREKVRLEADLKGL
jgi:hypothetical protein